MVNKIIINSRKQMIDFLDKNSSLQDTAIISICSKEDDIVITESKKEALFKAGCSDILILIFEDWTEEDKNKLSSDSILFDVKMACQTISFLDRIKKKEIKILYIHCDAGISRSGAVGIFACRYLGMNEKEFLEYNFISPNTLVYDTLFKISGLRDDYEKFWEKKLKKGEILIPSSKYKIRFTS